MEALQDWMKQNRFAEFTGAFVDKLGVECVDDLQLVTSEDLPTVGLKPVQARRFMSIQAARTSKLNDTVPPPLSPRAHASSGHTHLTSRSTDSSWHPSDEASPGDGPPLERVGRRGGSLDGAPLPHDLRQAPSDERQLVAIGTPSRGETDDDGADSDEHVRESCSPPSKRRKVNRLSEPQRSGTVLSEMMGTRRVRLPVARDNGKHKGPSEAASHRGTGHAPKADGNECPCAAFFFSLAPQLSVAKRTAREAQRVESFSGTRVQRYQTEYNYARLGRVAISVLFDGRGTGWCSRRAHGNTYGCPMRGWRAATTARSRQRTSQRCV